MGWVEGTARKTVIRKIYLSVESVQQNIQISNYNVVNLKFMLLTKVATSIKNKVKIGKTII